MLQKDSGGQEFDGKKISGKRKRQAWKSDSSKAHSSSTQSTQTSQTTPHVTRNVLIVDDDASTRMILAKIVSDLGHHSESASTGKEGVQLFLREYNAGNPFDSVFMDIQMETQTAGLEAIEEIRLCEKKRRASILCISSAEKSSETSLQRGADWFLKKPAAKRDINEFFTKNNSKDQATISTHATTVSEETATLQIRS